MITTSSLGSLLRRRFLYCASFGAAFLIASGVLDSHAAQLKEARVSQVIRDVKLLPTQAAPRPASVSDEVRDGTAVRTGLESRAELTFTDQTLARLGANTIFSFSEGTRNLELSGGAMLLRVPKDAGGARIRTAAVTAAITGTTVLLEYHPNAYIKFIILEGTGRIFRNDRIGESVLLHAGQMLIVNPKGKGLPDPVDVDLDRLIKTSLLINGFRPLPSDSLIARAIRAQYAQKTEGALVDTNLVIFGRGTIVSLLDPTNTDILDQANANETRELRESPTPTQTVTPTPTPDKIGQPVVIDSPNPYVINSGTTITTDPTITTNGDTAFGKIYRGPALDGAVSSYLFGSTSAFDQAIGFDEHFQDINLLPLAVFKFAGLRLSGNPTISTANGGTDNLALISVGDITSGSPGGTLTFGGLNSLILATQNGSITLGSNITFQGIPELALYARGLGSNLTINSAISGTNDFFFGAEGSILSTGALSITQTNNGSSIGLFGVVIAGIDLITGNSLTITADNSGGFLALGADITVNAGRNLTVNGGGDLSLSILNNDGGQIGDGGTIDVHAGGDLSAGALSLLIDNSNGGDIGSGGKISLSADGNLTADSIDLLINNRDGGSMESGASINFDVAGAVTTQGDASFIISARDDGGGSGTFGGDVNLSVQSASMSIGGDLISAFSMSAGGNAGEVFDSVFVNGKLSTTGNIDLEIDNGGSTMSGLLGGGMISNNATLNLSALSISSGGAISALITNVDGGTIGGNALIDLLASGAITAQGPLLVKIFNNSFLGGSGGTINGDALITVDAGSLSADSLTAMIDNTAGTLGGLDAIVFDISGKLSTSGDATFKFCAIAAKPAVQSRSTPARSTWVARLLRESWKGKTEFSSATFPLHRAETSSWDRTCRLMAPSRPRVTSSSAEPFLCPASLWRAVRSQPVVFSPMRSTPGRTSPWSIQTAVSPPSSSIPSPPAAISIS